MNKLKYWDREEDQQYTGYGGVKPEYILDKLNIKIKSITIHHSLIKQREKKRNEK